jgi:nicotinamide mononucleotide transporter
MDLSIFNTLYENILQSTWLEAVAVIFGLLSVWFAKKENILVYPTGIINVLIYVYICLHVKLYADMSINAFYFVMSLYGWYKWTRKDAQQHIRPIARASRKENILAMAGTLGFFVVIYYILKNYTDSSVPYWDAFTTALFIIGMWMMALKKIENWIYWIIGDLLVIPLFAYKGLVLTSIQYFIFLALAISGYVEWKRKLITHHSSL